MPLKFKSDAELRQTGKHACADASGSSCAEFGLALFASRSQPLAHNIDDHYECQGGIAGEEHKVKFAHG